MIWVSMGLVLGGGGVNWRLPSWDGDGDGEADVDEYGDV